MIRIGNRRVVARTCPDCGRFMDARHFNRNSAGYFDKVCSACRAATARSRKRYRDREAERDAARHRTRQVETQASARRNGQEWTGFDLEMADRDDIPIREIARMLGRTYDSVLRMRQKMRQGVRGDD